MICVHVLKFVPRGGTETAFIQKPYLSYGQRRVLSTVNGEDENLSQHRCATKTSVIVLV